MASVGKPMVVGLAAGSVCFAMSSAFVVPGGSPATERRLTAPIPEVRIADVSYGSRFAALAAASSVALAATGLASLRRRRSSVTSHGFNPAVRVDPIEPVPGSEKVSQTMVIADVEMGSGAYAVAPSARVPSSQATFCGSSASCRSSQSRTSVRYTTQEILPAFAWIDSGIKSSDLQPRQLIAKNVAGNDVLIGKTEQGALFCVSNLCPHIGTPMSEGADVIGDVIVCPLHGSSFSTKTGDLIDWCPSPPIIGPLTGLVVEKKNLYIFETRTPFFGGGNVEVQVDTNAKRAYEAAYWKGILDAQGKDDGTYY